MSAISWNAEASSPPILATEVSQKRSFILNHIAGGKRAVEVCPASQLEVRPRPEMMTTGIAELDALTGGLPRGCLSDICGLASSGKSSVLLAAMAAATRRGESCVLIDSSDSFDPESGAAAGVVFGKLLWVRCGRAKKSLAVGRSPLAAKLIANDRPNDPQPFLACPEKRSAEGTDDATKTWKPYERRLEQVLKATDLILQSGGFGLVALDLAGVPERYVRRIPLASWFRFQRAVEHTKTALLVVSEFACAQTCASVVLKLSAQPSAISHQPSVKPLHSREIFPPSPSKTRRDKGGAAETLLREPTHAQLLEKMQIEAELARTRIERKPARSAHAKFTTRAVRAG